MPVVTRPNRAGSQCHASLFVRNVTSTPTSAMPMRFFGEVLVSLMFVGLFMLTTVSSAFAFTPGLPLDTGFPRLAAYLPGTATAADAAEAARFDWIALSGYQLSAIAGMKAINPDLITLRRTSAVEEDVAKADELSRIPAAWILTQVGSTLSGNVDAASQSIPVASLTNGSLQLFAVGQNVVIGGEIVTITGITASPATLIVTRGTVYPATQHAAGERVAAAVTAYPGTVTMDITDRCPAVDLGDGNGPQTWRTWRVRDTITKVSDPAWDGVFNDMSEGHKSHWVSASSPTHSIDYLRNNVPVADGYVAFDSSWDAGMKALDTGIVAGLHGRIYFTNGPFPDYALRNGTTFEDFPSFPWWDWQSTVFGPRSTDGGWLQGSVTDWMKAAEPNLTTLLVYPTPHSNTTLDYRLMRYGLTSALIAGSHYSYEIGGTPGVQPWFDEYDGGGKGAHYLGQPLGAAYPVQTPGAELMTNSTMGSSTDVAAWTLYNASPAVSTKSFDSGALKVSVTKAGGPYGDVNLYKSVAGLTAGTAYTLSFDVKSSVPMTLSSIIREGWNYFPEVYAIPSVWTHYEFSTVASGAPGQIRFNLGMEAGDLWIKNVSLRTGSHEVWRRDFQNGVALVNASGQNVSIDLGGTFRKISGTQDPTVNDGSLVTSVTIPTKDGLVLLRTAPVVASPDITPPSTTISALPAGWAKGDVAFSLTASDTDSPSGIASLYALNGSAPSAYTGSVTVSAEGTTSVAFSSVDASGNAETTKTATVRIDTTSPQLSVDAVATYSGSAAIHATAADTLSGLDHIEMKLDSGAWITGTQASTAAVGTHTLYARAFDVAGNERDLTAGFTVQALPAPTPTPVPTPDSTVTPAPAPASTVTLRTSSSTLTYGQTTTLRFTVSPVASLSVRVERRTSGSSLWESFATLTTDGTGNARFTVTPLVTTDYRMVLANSGTVSKSVTVVVRARATVRSSKTSVSRKSLVTISGTVTGAITGLPALMVPASLDSTVPASSDATVSARPAAPVLRAMLQRRVGHRWVNVKAIIANAAGSYRVNIRPRVRGTYSYRIVVGRSATNAAGVSRTIKIRVH
jgi:hypothetical protein